MTNEQKQVKDWMQAFGQECPERPTIPSLKVRKLRAKLIFEEAVKELINLGLGLAVRFTDAHTQKHWILTDTDKVDFIEIDDEPNLVAITDGCSDLSVVNYGTLVACGLLKTPHPMMVNRDPLFDEVMRSNWSKAWTFEEIKNGGFILAREFGYSKGWARDANLFCEEKAKDKWLVKDASGKVIKSPSYSPANLTPIINGLPS